MASDTTLAAPGDWSANLSLKFFRYRMLVKRRWWVLALTISAGLAWGAWVSYQKPTEYSSYGELTVSETIDGLPGQATIHDNQDYEGFYGTNLKILQGEQVQKRAMRRVAMDSPNLKGTITDLTATRSPNSSIFYVSALGTDPAYTQAYVNAVIAEFINFKQETRKNVADKAATEIAEEVSKQRVELDEKEKELRDYVDQNDMSAWAEQSKEAATFLADLNKKRARMETELDRMQNLTSEELLNMPASEDEKASGDGKAASTTETPISMDLATQYLQKSLELSRARALFTQQSKVWKPKHPKLIAIQDEITTMKGELEDIKAQNAEQTKVQIGATKAELASLDQNIKSWEVKARDASHKNDAYQERSNARDRAEALYTQLLNNLKSVREIKTIGSDETIQPLQEASDPERVSRKTAVHLLAGFLGGLVAGSLLLMVLDRADDRISSSTEVMKRFSEPIVGQIPNVSSSRTPTGLPLLHSEDDRYTFAESFRSLRSSLIFMPNQGDLRTIIVTSAIPGEGKSTVASNLAITMSLAGARVLLVDADLRRGDLTELFKMETKVGLSSVLRGEVTRQDAYQKTMYPTLTLMPSGPVTNQSAELLLRPTFPKLLAECREEFDLTIFNTSPILATDDTATISPNFDGTLMVVRAQFTSARLVSSSLKALYQRQVNVLGLILNCVDTEMPDYYYYRYPKYYAA